VIDPGLDGRVALVTARNHGIGASDRSGAERPKGAKVFVSYLRDYLRTRVSESEEFYAPRSRVPDDPRSSATSPMRRRSRAVRPRGDRARSG